MIQNKRKTIIFLSFFALLLIISITRITYGYFSLIINKDNNSEKSISAKSKTISVLYKNEEDATMNFQGDYFFPGDSATKEFEVENNGTVETTYSILIENVINEFVRIQDLRYELYINDELVSDGAINNNEVQYLYYDKLIEAGVTDKIRFELMYATTQEIQNVDMNKALSFRFNITSKEKENASNDTGSILLTNNNLNSYRIYGNSIQEGENLFDFSKKTNYYYYDKNGTYASDDGVFISDYISIEEGKIYKFSGFNMNHLNHNLRINYFNSNQEWESQELKSIASHTSFNFNIKVPSGISYVRFSFTIKNKNGSIYFKGVSPALDNAIDIESVGNLVTDENDENYGKYKIPIKVSGKNILNKNLLLEDNQELNENYATIETTETGFKLFKFGYTDIKLYDITSLVKPNTVYYVHRDLVRKTDDGVDYVVEDQTSKAVSGMIRIYVDDKSYEVNQYGNDIMFKVPENYESIEIHTYGIPISTHIQEYDSSKTYSIEWKNVYLSEYPYESYETYVEPTTYNIYLDEPLRRVGDVADYIDFKEQTLVRKIKETTVNGEKWNLYNFNNGTYVGFSKGNVLDKNYSRIAGMSNYNPYIGNYYSSGYSDILWIGVGNNYLFWIFPSVYDDSLDDKGLGNFKTILNNNSLVLQYPTSYIESTPIYIPNLELLNERNVISVETSVTPSNIEVEFK